MYHLILGEFGKKGIIDIKYLGDIDKLPEILKFARQLKDLKIKYSRDVSKAVNDLKKEIQNLEEDIEKRKTLIGRLNRE